MGELSVGLSPSSQAGRKVSFAIVPNGEVQWREKRLPIGGIGRVEPAEAKVEHSEGIVTVTIPKGHSGPILLTLGIDQGEAYTGYTYAEQLIPDSATTTEERVAVIRELMASGKNQTEIGKRLGISRQRVSQLVGKHIKGGQA